MPFSESNNHSSIQLLCECIAIGLSHAYRVAHCVVDFNIVRHSVIYNDPQHLADV